MNYDEYQTGKNVVRVTTCPIAVSMHNCVYSTIRMSSFFAFVRSSCIFSSRNVKSCAVTPVLINSLSDDGRGSSGGLQYTSKNAKGPVQIENADLCVPL